MTAPLLRVERLRIRYEGAPRPTPDGASFEVRRGEVVLLLGPSGCGKSTIALAAAGLIPGAVPAAIEGRVLLGGAPAETLPSGHAAEHVGIVFQDPDAQLVAATLDDEVGFGPENLGLPRAEIESRIEASLAAVDLLERRDDAPETLSGGGRQRLAIAAALALHAPLLILDEPTANLDPANARGVYDAVARLVADGEHGVLLVEHDLDEALRVATRVVALDAHGRVIADDTPREVLVDRADELAAAGIWLPTGVEGARALARAGVEVPGRPLTADEFIRAAAACQPEPTAAAEEIAPPPAPDDARRALLDVAGLTVAVRGRRLLHDVTLRLPEGSFTAVVGPNGAGKSTLLHALAGVDRPPRGVIRLDGDDLARLTPRELRRRLGVVFQNPEHQFLRQRVRDELELGLDPADPATARRVDELLARFGLTEFADAHPFLLSGGQKRRLSVGTALVEGARLLVLDEPTYGQDRARTDELLALLHELRDDGTTIIMATHDLQLVLEHASDVIVLGEGRVVAAGPVGEVVTAGAFEAVGLGLPPLARALRAAPTPSWRWLRRLDDVVHAVAGRPADAS